MLKLINRINVGLFIICGFIIGYYAFDRNSFMAFLIAGFGVVISIFFNEKIMDKILERSDYKILGIIGFLLIALGLFMPIAFDQNGFNIINYLKIFPKYFSDINEDIYEFNQYLRYFGLKELQPIYMNISAINLSLNILLIASLIGIIFLLIYKKSLVSKINPCLTMRTPNYNLIFV